MAKKDDTERSEQQEGTPLATPSCSLLWRRSSERAEEGRVVWIIEKHWKEIRPQSYEIHAGMVTHVGDKWVVEQADEAGNGSAYWKPEEDDPSYGSDIFCAWMYADEFEILPEFI